MEVIHDSRPAVNGTSNGVHATDTADPLLVLEHIARLIETNLGAARRELEAVGSLLSQSSLEASSNSVVQPSDCVAAATLGIASAMLFPVGPSVVVR